MANHKTSNNGRGQRNNNNNISKNSAAYRDTLESDDIQIGDPRPVPEILRKTTTRTFRIDEDISALIEKTARNQSTTQTSLLNDILVQYFTWSQYIINHDSPFVTFGSASLLGFQEALDDATLEKIVKNISNEEAVNFIRYRWRKVNFRNIVRYLSLLSTYANVGNIRIVRQDHNGNDDFSGNDNFEGNKDNGNNNSNPNGFEKYEIAVRHHLGKKWSTYMAIHISNLFTTSITGAKADYDVSNNSCFVNLEMPIKNSVAGQ